MTSDSIRSAASPARAVTLTGRGVRLTALPPLALYIHVPWCVRKCPYCDFNSHELRDTLPERAYIDALIGDLEQALPQVWGRRVHTIFFGGGTPSLLRAQAVDEILAAVRARLSVSIDAEITLEANPGTFEVERFRGFRSAGVNRLSLGVQSFDGRFLQALGRIHDHDQAKAAAKAACEIFDNVNLGSCMDYTSNPAGPPSHEHPNAHDYKQLEIIYAHLDGTSTVASSKAASGASPATVDQVDFVGPPAQWGRLVRSIAGGRVQEYERGLGAGNHMITRVIWADPAADAR